MEPAAEPLPVAEDSGMRLRERAQSTSAVESTPHSTPNTCFRGRKGKLFGRYRLCLSRIL